MSTRKGKILICVLTVLVILLMLFSTIDISANEGSAKEGVNHSTSVDVPYKEVILNFQEPKINAEGEYIKISVDNCSFLFDEGKPLLPKKTLVINLQFKTKVSSVDIDVKTKEKMLNKKLMLSPNPQSLDKQNTDDSKPVLPLIYPEEWYEYNVIAGIDPETNKETNFLVIHFYPVRYIENENKIIYSTSANIKIRYNEEKTSKDVGGKGLYDMVVVSPSSFSTVVENFAEYKNSINVITKVVTLDEIYDGVYFPVQGRDNPEKIKYFIKNAKENWSISYVLLAGDTNVLPVRYADVGDEDTPTDLYYADVFDSNGDFCSWDDNKNNIFGEFNVDGVDGGADVYIGRLPASDASEMQLLVNKIMNYELPDASAWFNNALLVGTDTFDEISGVPEGEYVKEHIADNYMSGFNVTKLYETDKYEKDDDITTENILNSINDGVGFVDFSNHGSSSGVIYLDYGSGACMLSSADVDTLTNGNKLPVVIADACDTNKFDNSPFYDDCLGEHFMLNPNGGSIVFIGSTRTSWGLYGEYDITRLSGYMDVHLHKAYHDGEDTPGKMMVKAQNDYILEIGFPSDSDYMTVLAYNMLGDPSLHIGGGLDIEPPTSCVNPILPYEQISPFTMTGTANDTLPSSGVKNVSLYYRYSENNVSWGSWKFYDADEDVETGVSWKFYADDIGYYQFYSIAMDKAGNREEKPSTAEAMCEVTDIILEEIKNLNAVDNVSFQGSPTSDSVKLTWTSPEWRAVSYEIRYRINEEINDANWDTSENAYCDLTPSEPGEKETFWVNGLDKNTKYYFAIRGENPGGYESNISGCVSITTLDLITWLGNKIITDITYINRTELHLAGDLYIAKTLIKTGKLSLDNSFLILDSTVDFQYRIWVAPSLSEPGYLEGGGLYVYKSNITSSYGKYILKVWPKGDFSLKASSIRYCGGALEDISPEYFERGLEIYSGDTCIEDSLISECRGVFVYVSIPNIIDTTFKDNYYGVKFESVLPTEGTPVVPAYVNLLRNDFINNNIGVFCDGSRVRLTECNFMNNNYGAIYNNTPTDYPGNVSGVIYNCVFENNAHGIESKTSFIDLETVTMTNNTHAINATTSSLSITDALLSNNGAGIFCTGSSLDISDSTIINRKNTVEITVNVTIQNETIEETMEYSYGIISLLTQTKITRVTITVDATDTSIGVLCAGAILNFDQNTVVDTPVGVVWAFSKAWVNKNRFENCDVGIMGTSESEIPEKIATTVDVVPFIEFPFAPIIHNLIENIEEKAIEGIFSNNTFYNNLGAVVFIGGEVVMVGNNNFVDNTGCIVSIMNTLSIFTASFSDNEIIMFALSSTVSLTNIESNLSWASFVFINSSVDMNDVSVKGVREESVHMICVASKITLFNTTIEDGMAGILVLDTALEYYLEQIEYILQLYDIHIPLSSCSELTLTDCRVIDNVWWGILINDALFTDWFLGLAVTEPEQKTVFTFTDVTVSGSDSLLFGYEELLNFGGLITTFADGTVTDSVFDDNYKCVILTESIFSAVNTTFSNSEKGIDATDSTLNILDKSAFINLGTGIACSDVSGSIMSSSLTKCGTGISTTGSTLSIINNTISENADGITSVAGNVNIKDNHINYNNRGVAVSSGSPNITGNHFKGNTMYSISLITADGYISGNEIFTSGGSAAGGSGIYCNNAYPTISNNIISDSNDSGIYVRNSFDGYVTIKNNAIYESTSYGIYSQNSMLNITDNIIGNAVIRSDTYGIYGRYSTFIITNNDIKRNYYGVYCKESALNVAGDSLSWNTYGIYVTSSSSACINGATISNNSYGAYFDSSSLSISNATITNNNVADDSYGIYLLSCPDPGVANPPTPKIMYSIIMNNNVDLNCSGSRLECINCTINTIYLYDSDLDCIGFTPDFNNLTFADNSSKMEVSFYLTVFVKWQNNEPVSNASVKIYNINDVPTNLSTDSNGILYTKILALKLNKTIQTTHPDGVTFMPHRVNASKNDIFNETGEIWVNETYYVELVLYDFVSPLISIDPALPYFDPTTNKTLALRGIASDNINISMIEIFDGVKVKWVSCEPDNITAVNRTPGNYTVEWSGITTLKEGFNTVYVRVKDPAGNNRTDSITITLDTTAPILSIISPLNNTKTNQSTIELVLQINGTYGEEVVLWINHFSTTVTLNTTFRKNLTLSEGENTFSIYAVDGMGNGNDEPKFITIVVFDNTPPASGIAYIKNPINTLTSITGVANDDISGIKKVEICITRGNDGYYWTGSAWSSSETWLNASGTSEWSYPWTPETDGVYTIKSRATDNADNTETPSSGITFTYDTTLPTLTNIKPSNNTETESGTITVSGETDGVNVTVNGEYADVKDGKFSATVKLGTGNNGRNVITINATDLAGNTNQTTIIIKRISGEWVPPATEWIALSAGVIVIALIISVFVLYKKKIIKLKLHKEKAETEKTGENVLHKEKMGTGKPKENVGFSFKEK